MDSGGSAVVELGRFMTGFLVVMGVGQYTRAHTSMRGKQMPYMGAELTVTSHSFARGACALRYDPRRGHGHEYCRGASDLRNYHKLHHVLSAGGGVLSRAVERML